MTEMIVAGMMSGTSADGINVALVRIGQVQPPPNPGAPSGIRGQGPLRLPFTAGPRHTIELLAHAEYPYPPKVRAAVLAAMNSPRASVADLSRLNFLLGELYADAVIATQKKFRAKAHLVGCHGQTLYHQGQPQLFLGRRIAATWQTGEAAIIAARVGVPVISDFRPSDMAAGGKGAPLVPYLDYLFFSDPRVGRIVQNIGGIANMTAIPAGASAGEIFAFDCGPGNMVIDAVTESLFGRSFDRAGGIGATGTVLHPVVQQILHGKFFRAQPPKTAGREEFGREFVADFIRLCGRARKQDIVATATALTAGSIADAICRFVIRKKTDAYAELVLSGGGTKNPTLLAMLAEAVKPLGLQVRLSDEFGLPSEAKEAVAFAVLAYETWHHRPSNVPAATGAKRPAILGKISYA
jgi:anhydro-N-acetylmuramic acid kinase